MRLHHMLSQYSTNSPIKAVVGIISQCEWRHNQTTSHGAHLLTQPLCILTNSLIAAS